MILSRRSGKTLHWAATLGLACLGLALLPVPVRAQQAKPGNVGPIEVEPAKKTPMSVEEQIESLRRALKRLEDQVRKQQEPVSPSKPDNPASVGNLPQLEEQLRKSQGQGGPASVWPANWHETNKIIDEINRLTGEEEENRTLYDAGRIKLRRARAELALLKAKPPADPKETNKVIDEINRLTREEEENRTLYNASRIMLGRAYKALALLRGTSAGSKEPSNVVPVAR